MKGGELAESWIVAFIAAYAWYNDAPLVSAILWAAFFVCVKLDSVIDAIREAERARSK